MSWTMRWLVIRAVISAGLLAWLLHRINAGTIANNLAHASAGWIIAANVLTAPVIVLVSWKWQILLHAAGVSESLPRLVRMNLVGGFYSLVLPGEETGQLAKGLILARQSKGDAVAASIVVDEILGTLSIFTIALVALGLTHPFPLRLPIVGALLFMLAVFLALLALAVFPQCHGLARFVLERGLPLASTGLGWLLVPPPLRWVTPRTHLKLMAHMDSMRSRFVAWLEPFWESLARYRRRPSPLLAAFAITIAAHLLANVSVLSTMQAVQAEVSYLDICWVVAAISALVTIPITVSGFGIREGANVIILGQLGVAPSRALAVSLLAFAIGFVWSLPGALLQFGIRSKELGRPAAASDDPAAAANAATGASS